MQYLLQQFWTLGSNMTLSLLYFPDIYLIGKWNFSFSSGAVTYVYISFLTNKTEMEEETFYLWAPHSY